MDGAGGACDVNCRPPCPSLSTGTATAPQQLRHAGGAPSTGAGRRAGGAGRSRRAAGVWSHHGVAVWLQVDGFPPPGEVLTVYVAHDIQGQHEDPLVLDYLVEDPQIKGKGLDRAKCQKALEDIGFDQNRISLNISTLSGAAGRSHTTTNHGAMSHSLHFRPVRVLAP